ncbi:uncharacterized protein LOC127246113 [Andrographis paniculata]|uniref:uncharacterized protein LOC127246113 n=1 Tax=Andrographis paniculata TaxID=175694 RepID=UPI0021E8BDE3|nr:uncharacterized protein LOC127246113 [Andrographis paniculata]XP_051123296.1 uncharacterized protein LOC127246113 [Andrographis paniculata]XP_051123297.1 uncharacterized protein LOC127246113 [Andrographis paniculata]
MIGCSTSGSMEAEDKTHQDALPDCTTIPKNPQSCPSLLENKVDAEDNMQRDGDTTANVHEEEDEEEDADFNPFLKDTNSIEASSSLSSEVEDVDTDVTDSKGKPSVEIMHTGRTVLQDEDVVMRTVSPAEVCVNKSNAVSVDSESLLISQSEGGAIYDKDNDLLSLTDVGNNADFLKPQLDMDSEGAICMRTRARYSLANFTLDELETFLQETDDEEDLQNVDDEEEYRKFLAAVLRGDDYLNIQESANADDEDEENDVDFELELEEALESEPEEIEERRRTRRNRSQRTSNELVKLSGQLTRPLRPLLPFASLGSQPTLDGKYLSPNISPSYTPPNGFNCGFTPHQIGQLHCLIHEHVQLLIQVFSICVFEPLKHHITAQTKELILELLQKRDQLLAWRTLPYPSFCFFPPHIHPSLPNEVHKMLPQNCSNKNQQHEFPSGSNRELHSDITSFPISPANLADEQAGSSQAVLWVPNISGPVLSVIDVAPLRLVENYINDVSSAVQAHERYQIELGFDSQQQKEPLFPLGSSSCNAEADGQGNMENPPPESSGLLSSSNNQMPKKTMAATLLEKAKNQSIALVPKEISELAQRFRPLFNPALYPHKPPPAPLAKRVLFTDAEDELLALGLMEYNTDWKAIQLRFLPCKSRHQIFVRQKNRASSKAPENPIKAVRRMKNSPLTSEEIARIEMGLKKFKLDWISIWRFFVPYRDPSLLPRQWRIACGTQKSYKSDVNKKAKRRLYELRRKASKACPSTWHSSSEKEGDSTDNAVEDTNSGDNRMDKEDEAYVHEAFLADWMPENNVSASFPTSLQSDGSQAGSAYVQPSVSSKSSADLRPSYSQVVLRPYRARRPNNARTVKLAPDLPPVNLPPSVRIISQSAFQSSHAIAATKMHGTALRIGGAGQNLGQHTGSTMKSDAVSSVKCGPSKNNIFSSPIRQQPNHSDAMVDKSASERVGADLQMHPLLFQALQDGQVPYYPQSSSTSTSSSFTFFSGRQPQLSLSLFHNPRDIRDAVNFLSKSSKTPERDASSPVVDFHPLLQKTHDVDTNSIGIHPASARVPSTTKSRQKHAATQSPCGSTRKPSLQGGSSASTAKNVSHVDKSNEIDLDIHLSFTTTNQEAVGSKNMAIQNAGRSVNGPVSGPIESESARDSRNMRISALDGIDDELDSSDFALIASKNKGNRKVSEDMCDDSLHEIIMEQEELSDSEEESGENVEFEHEEMADSDGESTSDSQQFISMPNEDVHQDDVDADVDDCWAANAQSKCRGKMSSKSGGLEVAEKVAKLRANAESLNLNSCPQVSLTTLKKPQAEYEFGPFGTTGTVGQKQLSASSRRSSRNSKGGRMQKPREELPGHQNPGCASDAMPRNPRKRVCRSNSNSSTSNPNMGMDVRSNP